MNQYYCEFCKRYTRLNHNQDGTHCALTRCIDCDVEIADREGYDRCDKCDRFWDRMMEDMDAPMAY